MITAVDTNILLDLLIPGALHAAASTTALAQAFEAGGMIISEPVCAELGAQFSDTGAIEHFLLDTGLRLVPSSVHALTIAGQAWRTYTRHRPSGLACPQCGAVQEVHCTGCGAILQPRQHVVADFMIGAHALVHADQLLTRDRRYYGTYFPRLRLA